AKGNHKKGSISSSYCFNCASQFLFCLRRFWRLHGQRQERQKGRVPIVVEKEKGVFSRYPKNQLAHGVSQTEEEHAYGRRYTKIGGNGRIIWAGSVERSATGKSTRDDHDVGRSGTGRGIGSWDL